MNWKVVAKLYAGSFRDGNDKESGYDISNLHFDFDIQRSVVWHENSALFNIYNASKDTINRVLYEGAGIIFEGGYETKEVGTVFVGNICKAYSEAAGNDVVTRISCASVQGAEYPLIKIPVTLAFKKGVSVYDVLKQISDYAAMPLADADTLMKVLLEDDFNYSGQIQGAFRKLNAILNRNSGGKVYFDNGRTVYMDRFSEASEADVTLNYDNGLLSASPVRSDGGDAPLKKTSGGKAPYYYNGSEVFRAETQDAIDAGRKRIVFRALMNPGVTPNTRVSIKSTDIDKALPDVDGSFLVHKVNFKGNNYGGNCCMIGEALE